MIVLNAIFFPFLSSNYKTMRGNQRNMRAIQGSLVYTPQLLPFFHVWIGLKMTAINKNLVDKWTKIERMAGHWKSVSYMYNIWSSKHVQNNFLILLLLLLTFICLVCTMICIYTWGVPGSLWAGRWKQNIFRLVQFFFFVATK